MKAAKFAYERPADVAAALALLGDTTCEAKPVAGGQSLGPMLNLRLARPDLLVDIGRLAELTAVEAHADAVVIGAAVTHADIEDGRVPDPTGGMLRHVASDIAYRAVRNRGTIGGSLAHADPSADWVTTVAACGGEIVLRSGAGSERRVAAERFVLGAFETALAPGELLCAIGIPRASSAARWGYHKICRKTGEYAQAIGAVMIDPARGMRRAVIGATNGAPRVADADDDALAALLGARDEATALAAAERLVAALGLSRDHIEQRLHAVALARAALAASVA